MNNQDKIQEILNKQFKAKPYAGYDPLEVDEFLDGVIDYLKNNELIVSETNGKLDKANEKIKQLSIQIESLTQELDKANETIRKYKDDGYDNVTSSEGYIKIVKNVNKGK